MRRDAPEMIGWLAGALAAAALAMGSAGRAAGDEPAVLRADLQIAGDQITLGDLFDVDEPAASAVVARAPEPGRRMSLEPDWVAETASRYGLDWANPAGLRRVTVTRASEIVPADEIAALIQAAIESEEGGTWAVRLADARPRHAPAGALPFPEIHELDRDPRNGRFTALVSLAPELEPERLEGRAEPAVEVPVLARPLARDDVITEADIDWRLTPASSAPANALANADAIIGMAARRALRAGAPLRAYDLTRPAAVRRGDTVLIVYETPGLRLTARGRAMADAALGENARFVNLHTNRIIDAVVEGPGLARAGSIAGGVAGGRP